MNLKFLETKGRGHAVREARRRDKFVAFFRRHATGILESLCKSPPTSDAKKGNDNIR